MFLLLEQFMHWHHCHNIPCEHKKSVIYLVLLSDSVHNFIGGLAIGGAFLVDVRLGIITWLVSAAHEIPQEMGEFGILLHGGWNKSKALFINFLTALTIIPGGILVYFFSKGFNITFLLAFAAGNFIYIAASDLIPDIKSEDTLKKNLLHFFSFSFGILIILILKIAFK